MKITKQQLKQMIKEEVGNIVKEWDYDAEASKRSQWDRNWRQSHEPKRKRNPPPPGWTSEEEPQQADSFSDHLSLSRSIRDAIIGHLENEKLFEMGALPQSVIRVIENSSLRIADAAKGMD